MASQPGPPRPVPPYYVAGLLRFDPNERCDPRFAELNAAIESAQPEPGAPMKQERLERLAASMRAKYSRRRRAAQRVRTLL